MFAELAELDARRSESPSAANAANTANSALIQCFPTENARFPQAAELASNPLKLLFLLSSKGRALVERHHLHPRVACATLTKL